MLKRVPIGKLDVMEVLSMHDVRRDLHDKEINFNRDIMHKDTLNSTALQHRVVISIVFHLN